MAIPTTDSTNGRIPAARRQQTSALGGLSWALEKYFRVPDDMPDAFVKAFARLDSSEHKHEESKVENRSRRANGGRSAMNLDEGATVLVGILLIVGSGFVFSLYMIFFH
jgi:hypothetical protein